MGRARPLQSAAPARTLPAPDLQGGWADPCLLVPQRGPGSAVVLCWRPSVKTATKPCGKRSNGGAVRVIRSPPAGGVKVSPLGRLGLRGRPKAPCQPPKASPTPRARPGFFLISFASLGLSMLTIRALPLQKGRLAEDCEQNSRVSARSSRPAEQL